VVRNPLLSGGPIITLVKWRYSAGKSVFGVTTAIIQWPTMWPTSKTNCIPDPQQQQQQQQQLLLLLLRALGEVTCYMAKWNNWRFFHRCLISECEGVNSTWDVNSTWISSAIPNESDSCTRYKYVETPGDFGNLPCSNESFSNETYACSSFHYKSEEWTMAREVINRSFSNWFNT